MALLLLAGVAACRPEFKEMEYAQNGPQVTVQSCDASAIMGGSIDFNVAVSDAEFDLSTLKAYLLFDDTEVDAVTIRTKQEGTYGGKLQVPFLANIPDGNATVRFVAQNVGLAKTVIEQKVAVSRPLFDYLTLVGKDGSEYRMEKGEGFEYSVTADFPAQMDAIIVTAPVGDNDTTFTFGFSGGAIGQGGDYIPFSGGIAGNYTISFNTLTWTGSPFVTLNVNGVEAAMVDADNYSAVVSLKQGEAMVVEGYAPGFAGWTIDPDFIEATGTDGSYTFLAVDGLYKVNIGVADRFFKFEAMASTTELGRLADDCTGALWLIGGACYGKPAIWKYSWNPEAGGLCFAQVSPKVHQMTFVAGVQIQTSDIDVKFFGQKTWGTEFGGANTTDSDMITIGESDGNIHLASGVKLDMGGIYRFTVDLNPASVVDGKITGSVVHFEKVGQQEVEAPKVVVNGVELAQDSATDYSGTVSFTKGGDITVTGIDDLATYYLDPDYLELSGSSLKFKAADGLYKVAIHTASKDVRFNRMKDASTEATINEHGLWLMGWGVASPSMDQFQFGWTPGAAYCMAEVADHVYRFSGKASDGEHDTAVGTRFRNDYISLKYFAQDGWGGEKGKIFGSDQTVVLTERAATLLKDAGNIELADGVQLEPGAPYVLTIDLSVPGTETIDFYKDALPSVNGVTMSEDGSNWTALLDLAKDDAVVFADVPGFSSLYLDPDYLVPDGDALKFGSASGLYKVTVRTDAGDIRFVRMKDASSEATINEHGLWLMGWGVASPSMDQFQFGWTPGAAYCMAEVADHVYQFSGLASDGEHDTAVGTRFRSDYVSLKYFAQDGWGGEKGKMFGSDQTVVLTERASALLKDSGNVELADGVNLETGAFYVLTIDLSVPGTETVDFYKR